MDIMRRFYGMELKKGNDWIPVRPSLDGIQLERKCRRLRGWIQMRLIEYPAWRRLTFYARLLHTRIK